MTGGGRCPPLPWGDGWLAVPQRDLVTAVLTSAAARCVLPGRLAAYAARLMNSNARTVRIAKPSQRLLHRAAAALLFENTSTPFARNLPTADW